ncbi:hypothetical protein CRUP_018932, partial [Coryphaenoides rupestris]
QQVTLDKIAELLHFAALGKTTVPHNPVLRLHPVIGKFGTAVKGLTAYTLTREEMIKGHFPVRGDAGFEDFVSTESADYVTDSSPLYGLDCEMLIHPHVIDTSLLYRKEFGQKFKLKVLAETILAFADVLQRSGQSVIFVGKRADITINPSNQQWHSSDREVKVLASFRRQAAWLSFSVVQFSSFSDHRVNMLPTAHRIHAEIEFRRLEGAVLAVDTLNGHSVACGQHIQVQRPVNESTLDLDLTLDALKEDPANVNRVHVTRLKPYTNDAHADAYNAKMAFNGTPSMNGHGQLHLQAPAPAACTALSEEEDLTDVFGRFGAVEGIVRAVKLNGRPASRHASITFQSPDGVAAALGSAEELRSQGYLVCPSLTPDHLHSWAPGGHMETEDEDGETERVMKKLDRHLRKLFKSLPDHTLSVVVLPGHTSSTDCFPGLCFMEVKDAVL